jgi:3D-(3,5/4)-trihydroxycyclohexane-1,2-dione acylhydrolase (decyclizing)
MKTRLTMAQALVKFLDRQYVSIDGAESKFVVGVFAIFGHGNVLGIGEALEQNPGSLMVHQGRSEQGMGHAAIGFAKQRLRRQIYACTASVGPGSANLLTVAATATANRIPLLLLPGDVFASRQPNPVLQQIEQFHDLSISTNDAFRPLSRYFDRIERPEQLMSAGLEAMRTLTDPELTGAVTLALPQDVQGEAYEYPEGFFEKRVHRIDRRPPAEGAIAQAVATVRTRAKPLLICGGGTRYSGAAEALLGLAEKCGIPFAETQAGKGTIASAHPLNVGGIGVTGTVAANSLAAQADLIIGVGTRYSDFTTGSKSLFRAPDVTFVNINVGAFDAGKLDGMALVADARLALEALTAALAGYHASWGALVSTARAQMEQENRRVCRTEYGGKDYAPEVNDALDRSVLDEFVRVTGSRLTQTQVLGELNERLPSDAIVVASAGSLPGDLQRLWHCRVADTYHVEYGYSCMGYEINAALGVKLAEPGREVFALVGDGSYLMSHSELATSLQERRKINVILFDNMGFGCINNLQIAFGMGSFGTEFRYRQDATGRHDGPLIPIDYAAGAAAYGCKTYRVATLEQLRAALSDAARQSSSTLIDVKVLPKTMSHGYGAWWHVGVAEVPSGPVAAQAMMAAREKLASARQY